MARRSTQLTIDAALAARTSCIVRRDGEVTDAQTLRAQIGRCAERLQRTGLASGDLALIVDEEPLQVLVAFLSVLTCGGTPLVYAPRRPEESAESASKRAMSVLSLCTGRFVLGSGALGLAGICDVSAVDQGHPCIVRVTDDAPSARTFPSGFVQLSSGTTGSPKPLLIPEQAIMGHLAALQELFGLSAEDVIGSWLPLWHDFGLIGAALFALLLDAKLVLWSPSEFLASVGSWLDTLLAHQVSFMPLVPAGGHLLSRAARSFDVSFPIRAIPIGADVILPQQLREFECALGLDSGIALPAYGLADATLMVTATRPGEAWNVVDVARSTGGLVSLGYPLPGVSLRIDAAEPTESGQLVGEVVVETPWANAGRWLANTAPLSSVRTGDRGFIQDGLLYFVGRTKDVIRVDGEDYNPALLESCLVESAMARAGRVGAVGVRTRGRTRLVVAIVDTDVHEPDNRKMLALLRANGYPASAVVPIPHDVIPRTTSGKLRRDALAQWIEENVYG